MLGSALDEGAAGEGDKEKSESAAEVDKDKKQEGKGIVALALRACMQAWRQEGCVTCSTGPRVFSCLSSM